MIDSPQSYVRANSELCIVDVSMLSAVLLGYSRGEGRDYAPGDASAPELPSGILHGGCAYSRIGDHFDFCAAEGPYRHELFEGSGFAAMTAR
jgi:hypothetical protein